MTDKELIQALRCENVDCWGCSFIDDCSSLYEKATDRLEALLAENEHLREATKMVPKWISVRERLPENKQDVLAISNDGVERRVYPANYDHGKWFDCFFMEQNKHTTHWMPLPSTEGVE